MMMMMMMMMMMLLGFEFGACPLTHSASPFL
jgi:hypothetical protein